MIWRKKKRPDLAKLLDDQPPPRQRCHPVAPTPAEMEAISERASVHRALWLTIDVRSWLDHTMPAVWRQLVEHGPGPATVDGIDLASTEDAMVSYQRAAEDAVRYAISEYGYTGEPGTPDPTSFPALLHSRENAARLPDPEQLRIALAEATEHIWRCTRLPSLARALGLPETAHSWPQQQPRGR